MTSGSEDRLLAWLRKRIRKSGEDLLGDDVAILPDLPYPAITVDQQIAGVHFHPGISPENLARRLLAVNLSDLAATGAEARFAFLTLAFVPDFDVRRFFKAFLTAAETSGLRLAGGDLARSEVLSATLTLVGRIPSGGRPTCRNLARSGDRLWLGGTVGESAVGRHLLARGARMRGSSVVLPPDLVLGPKPLREARRAVRRHLQPRAQTELGLWLGRRGRAAAIDVSDGLALDLHRLCRESGLGAEIRRDCLPGPPGLETLAAALDLNSLDLMLSGGEDYVLLFALPDEVEPPSSFRCHQIGHLTQSLSVVLIGPSGRQRLSAKGWDHLVSESDS